MDGDIWVTLDENRKIWLTEVSKRTFESQKPFFLEHDSGLFLVLENAAEGSYQILAKVASIPSGLTLLSLFQENLRNGPAGGPYLSVVRP